MANKILITTVGTSLFENFAKYRMDNEYDVPAEIEYLKDNTDYKDWDDEKENINNLKEYIIEWMNEKKEDIHDCSAEIKSILKIKDEIKIEKVYLIVTETILSRLAAEIIQEKLENVSIQFDSQKDVIGGLQVDDFNTFNEKGFLGLINRIEEIKYSYFPNGETQDKFILNTTGGYKALNPIMTIIGQIENWDLKYIYEDSDALITIPGKLPISFNWDVVEAFSSYISKEGLKEYVTNSELMKELVELQLIVENKNETDPEKKYQVSIIGQLLSRYIEERSEINKGNLGLFLEYILYRYFNEEDVKKTGYRTKSKLSFNEYYKLSDEYDPNELEYEKIEFTNSKNDRSVGDIDLFLENQKGKPVLCEVKSFKEVVGFSYNLSDKQKDYCFKIFARIEAYHKNKGQYPEEFLLIIHRTRYGKDQSILISMDEKVREVIDNFNSRINRKYDGKVKLKVKAYYVDLVKKSLKVNYTDLLQNSIKESNWENIL
ncbi:MAG: putative CRISPR-associated protein [Leptospiraceae bacterium]|nr:putative CRISPR-associated protein [Leptospiraceae bacterium]